WGAKGMAWVRVTPDGSWQSPITRHLSETVQQQIAARAGLRPGHLLLFIADRPALASDILGRLRVQLGERLERRADRPWDLLFVVDFTLFAESETGLITFIHLLFVVPLQVHSVH